MIINLCNANPLRLLKIYLIIVVFSLFNDSFYVLSYIQKVNSKVYCFHRANIQYYLLILICFRKQHTDVIKSTFFYFILIVCCFATRSEFPLHEIGGWQWWFCKISNSKIKLFSIFIFIPHWNTICTYTEDGNIYMYKTSLCIIVEIADGCSIIENSWFIFKRNEKTHRDTF